jgi:hypothetical protein
LADALEPDAQAAALQRSTNALERILRDLRALALLDKSLR